LRVYNLYFDLPIGLSGQCTQAPCAVDHDAPQELGSKHGPGSSNFHQRIVSNNFYAHDEQAIIPRQEKRVRRCPLQSMTSADILSSSVKVVGRASVAEAARCG